MKLILIRGVSGSGKSTYASKLKQEDPSLSHYEADMFFCDEKGEYNYVQSLIGEAHAWCKARTEIDLRNGKSVIVSNTFTQRWEIQHYLNLAEKYGADVVIKKATGNYKNVHKLTEDIVQYMRDKWEDIEGEENI